MQYNQLSPAAASLYPLLQVHAAMFGTTVAEQAKIRLEATNPSPERLKAVREIYLYETSKTN